MLAGSQFVDSSKFVASLSTFYFTFLLIFDGLFVVINIYCTRSIRNYFWITASNSMLVHQSSTRRKSCSGCVKAKRRCDLRLPNCGRCRKRNLNCSFITVWENRAADEILRFEATVNGRKRPKAPQDSLQNRSSPGSSEGSSNVVVSDTFDFENSEAINIGDSAFNVDMFDDLQNQYVGCLDELSTVDAMSSSQPYLDFDLGDLEFSNNRSSLNWQISSGMSIPPSIQFPTIVHLESNQMEYGIRHFQSCIPSLVNTGNSPFIHDLFGEQCLAASSFSKNIYQDLFTVCSLQTSRIPRNASMINSVMNSKISSLLESSPKDRPFIDLLASVQALVVYQIMRLFGNNPEQRAIAERQAAYLYSVCEIV